MWGSGGIGERWTRLFNNRTAPAPSNNVNTSDFVENDNRNRNSNPTTTSSSVVGVGGDNGSSGESSRRQTGQVNNNLRFGDSPLRSSNNINSNRISIRDSNMEDTTTYVQIIPFDSYDIPKAKQRASIKWLLSKAYNHKTPEELLEPFYKDHEGEEHLKPHVVQGLSNAELYCLALCNLYADPNYSQLSPWGVVQALARKGVYVQPPPDVQLTETVLIQNTPLKLGAHMVVIEAMMVLQVKEIISNDRIVSSVQRYGPSVHPQRVWLGSGEMPSDTEEALLLWINRAVLAIKEYIQNNNAHEHNLTSTQVESWTQLPLFQDLSDLADGIGICSLLALYCQEEIALSEIAVPSPADPLSVSDSLWNLQLVHRVCRDSLPYNVCHFTLEDILYLHESMKQNMLSFLADLFNQLELQPSANVKLLGSHQIAIRPDRKGMNSRPTSATSTPKRQTSAGGPERSRKSLNVLGEYTGGRRSPTNASVVSVPIRRSGTPQEYNEKIQSERSSSKDQRYYAHSRSSDESEDFVVHRARNVPTLSQVIRSVSPSSQDERSSPASRMSVGRSISVTEDNEGVAAGRPSNWNANKTSYAGRRSRRNSITEADSQLTVENFGGSQDNLNKIAISRNPDKQPAIVTDSTSSPIRYVHRYSSEDPPDYYSNERNNAIPPKQSAYAKPNEVDRSSQRLSSNESGGGETTAFYGRKKYSHPMDEPAYYEERDGPPQEEKRLSRTGSQGNVTVYVMGQNQNQPQGSEPSSYPDSPQRSISNSNLSRLSDMQNKPVNIVYLSNSPAAPSDNNHSYSVTSSNGWDRSRQSLAPDYHTLPPSSKETYTSSTPHRSPYHQQQYMQGPSPVDQTTPHHYKNYESATYRRSDNASDFLHDDDIETEEIAAQVAAIRQKLEDRRRRIEAEKSRLETAACKQQQKLGKAAYLKAINKGKSHDDRGGSTGISINLKGSSTNEAALKKRQLTLQDLESKWLSKTEEPCRTPEIENMDIETYQGKLARMDSSLTELESDIGRLTLQQERIQKQFFLHQDTPTDRRSVHSVHGHPSSAGRSQWGAPKPFAESSSSDESTPRMARNSLYNGESLPKQIPKSGSASINYSGTSFRLHSNADTQGNRLFSSPGDRETETMKPTPPPRQSRPVYHAPLPTPPLDDMEPQSVSFVQDEGTPLSSDVTSISSKKSLSQITSGSKTYRITPESGSPPRPSAHKLFDREGPDANSGVEPSITSSDDNTSLNEKGFYITFDNEGPKRPKPPLRTRSPAKKRDTSSSADRNSSRDLTTEYVQSIVDRVPLSTDSEEDMQSGQRRRTTGSGDSAPRGELVLDEKPHLASDEIYEMEKKKERILLQSLKRQQQVEDLRRVKEMEKQRNVEVETIKQEEKMRKKEDEKARRQAILESYRLRKQDEMDKDNNKGWQVQENSAKRFMRPKSTTNIGPRPRPKTVHLSEGNSSGATRSGHGALRRSDSQNSSTSLVRSYGKRGSSNTLYSDSGAPGRSRSNVRDPWGSTSSLNQDNRRRNPSNTYERGSRRRDLSTSRLEVRSRRDTYLDSQESLSHRVNSTSSLLDGIETTDSSTASALRDSDSGLGTFSPPPHRRSPSPKPKHFLAPKRVQSAGPKPTTASKQQQPTCSLPSPSGTGPGSLPPGLISRRHHHRGFDDGASDISSVASSNMDYSGLRLYKQPTAKSNRSIMLNAVEYCVFPGVVNRDHKMRVLDEINRSESKHYLIMFRDAGCQFRALYSYIPEADEVVKLFGVGPKQVTDDMFEKFFKYNSGGKCFSQIHTKHLTVTIDAFTIHNALWQGKRVTGSRSNLPLVI